MFSPSLGPSIQMLSFINVHACACVCVYEMELLLQKQCFFHHKQVLALIFGLSLGAYGCTDWIDWCHCN